MMMDRTNDERNDIDDDDDDAKVAKMRQEFESFMLSGKKKPVIVDEIITGDHPPSNHQDVSKKKKKKKKKGKQSFGDDSTTGNPIASDDGGIIDTAPPPTTSFSSTTSSASTEQFSRSRTTDKKRYFHLLRSFNDKIQHSWFDTDDQMLSIIENIVSIRGRLPIEWKVLQNMVSSQSYSYASSNFDDASSDYVTNQGNDDRWKHFGFLGKPKETPYSSIHLQVDDIRLALSNDIMQHEKMLVELRRHMSLLAECHDAVGRIVDTMWRFHLECGSAMAHEDEEQDGAVIGDYVVDMDTENTVVQIVTEVFHMLSMELHRKQNLVPQIIESTKDELLGIKEDETEFVTGKTEGVQWLGMTSEGEGNDYAYGGTRGLQVARMCNKIWKGSSQDTFVDMSKIAYLIELGRGRVDCKE